MSIELVYPASLPTPQLAPIRSDERRLIVAGRPWEARTVQRQWVATREITFPPLTLEQATILRDWGRDDLEKWGNRFSATWPLPMGQVRATYVFLTVPRFLNIQARLGYYRVTALVEVTLSPAPLSMQLPLWHLHFDESLEDVQGHLFEADGVITDTFFNFFTYTTSDPVAGSHAGRFPGTNAHIRSEPFPDLQLAQYDWQVEGFVRPQQLFSVVGGTVVTTGSLQVPNGATIGPDPQSGQFKIEIDTLGDWFVDYADGLGASDLTPIADLACVLDEWNYFRLISDETSLRFYAGTLASGVATKIMETVGARPYAGAYDDLQRFFLGGSYAGGAPPLEVYTNRFHGDVDEWRFLLFTTADNVGAPTTIAIPDVPFSEAGA